MRRLHTVTLLKHWKRKCWPVILRIRQRQERLLLQQPILTSWRNLLRLVIWWLWVIVMNRSFVRLRCRRHVWSSVSDVRYHHLFCSWQKKKTASFFVQPMIHLSLPDFWTRVFQSVILWSGIIWLISERTIIQKISEALWQKCVTEIIRFLTVREDWWVWWHVTVFLKWIKRKSFW